MSHLILTQKSSYYPVYLEKNLIKLLLDKELYVNTETSWSKEAMSVRINVKHCRARINSTGNGNQKSKRVTLPSHRTGGTSAAPPLTWAALLLELHL